jgi:acyl carrier protein phosphodiesterase
MNYLAHMLLAGPSPQALLGNLAGDFLRGADAAVLAPVLHEGIALHRAVDRFTDAHPLVMRSRGRLNPGWRHYRGVLVDVFYDHFLAADFERIAGEPLSNFAARVYAALEDHAALLPPRLQRAAPVMVRHDWLNAYAWLEGLEEVLRGMGRRTRRGVPLHQAVGELRAGYAGFRADFDGFFPQLRAYAASSMHSSGSNASSGSPRMFE